MPKQCLVFRVKTGVPITESRSDKAIVLCSKVGVLPSAKMDQEWIVTS
jgi:hypothetical protein